jgi:hypothetical protein
MSEIDEAISRNDQVVAELGSLLSRAGLGFNTPDRPNFMGGGHVLEFADDVIVAVTAQSYNDHQFSITYGIAKDVAQEKLKVLEACNRHNQDLTAYPVLLHDAETGWDVLMKLTYPVQLFRDVPEFVLGWALNEGMGEMVRSARTRLAEADLVVTPHRWNLEDAIRLHLRSIIG